MKCIAAIDIGTTGAKCGIFDLDGTLLSNAYREYECEYPQPTWVEQDAAMLIAKAFEAVKQAVAQAPVAAGEIAGLSLSTQRSCSIFLDGQGAPLKMISWQDNRTAGECAQIASRIDPREYYAITGLPLGTTWVLTKILWVRKHLPDLWAGTKKVVQLHDYALKSLGAEDYYIDIPDAVLSGMWDNDRSVWSDRIIDLFGIDRSMLPTPVRCGARVGTLSQEAAALTGLPAGTPLCSGAGDQNAAAVGAGVIREGIASVSIGTGGMAITLLDKPYRDPAMQACIGSHAIYGKWQFEGYQTGAAGVFRWFRDEVAALEKARAQAEGTNAYDALNAMIADTPAGAEGLLFLPFLASAAAPRWNSNARGTLVGLTFAHSRKHMARAFMEGITLEQKDILRSMAVTGNRIDKVRIMGGASKSPLWCQMQADMYRTKVETLRVADAALVGAAIFSGLGVGLYADIGEAVRAMVHPEREYSPNPAGEVVYEKLYELYCKAYEACDASGLYEELSQFQADFAKREV